MKPSLENKCYSDWRRREAYAIPVTEEGQRMAEERYNEFKKGWEYGLRHAVFLIEQEHKDNKHLHKFYLLLAEKLREEMKND